MTSGDTFLLLNAFPSEVELSKFKVSRARIGVKNIKQLFNNIQDLSRNKIANCSFHGDYLYIKGDTTKALDFLIKNNAIHEQTIVEEDTDLGHVGEGIARELIYSAFEAKLFSQNWIAPLRRNVKRAIPQFAKAPDDLKVELSENITAIFGLKYMIEIRPNTSLLWLDVYTPIWSVENSRRLMREEITQDIKILYVQKAILQPKQRYDKLCHIVDALFDGKTIDIPFCDDETLKFSKELVNVYGQESFFGLGKSPFSFIHIREPTLRFRYGSSPDPRRIIRLMPYSYPAVKDIVVKVVVKKSLKNSFLKFLRFFVEGYSGNYMRWPGFSAVTGTKVSFDEKRDLVTVNADVSNYKEALIEIFSENDKPVAFIIVPDELHNFYYQMKALSLQRGKRIQVVRASTLTKEPLEFTLMNIATAVYAKAGGIPWLLEDSLLDIRGLVIGISFHLDHLKKEIYYGSVEVFDKWGRLLECKIRTFKFPEQIKERLSGKSLQRRITKGLFIPEDDMRKLLNDLIRKYDPRVVIIHKSATFHEEEKKAVEAVNKEKRSFEYCLIHVEQINPYRFFLKNAPSYMPYRGTVIFDSDRKNKFFVLTTGNAIVEQHKPPKAITKIGTPRPIEINIEENTSHYKLREIAKQMLLLTKLDWNTTDVAIRIPITIKYSNRAANLAPYIPSIEVNGGIVNIGDLRDLL